MNKNFEIRKSLPSDLASLEELYTEAFPDEDLLPLVRELLQETAIVLSLVGTSGSTLVGHIAFTNCGIAGHTDKVVLLGPLAVTPIWQRQGIGSAIVREGLKRMENAGVTRVCVLGDPAYYGRLGFAPETGVMPPYALPAEWRGAWQTIQLLSTEPPLQGKLSVPPPWLQPDLWAP
jgi:putative acetyltransferase